MSEKFLSRKFLLSVVSMLIAFLAGLGKEVSMEDALKISTAIGACYVAIEGLIDAVSAFVNKAAKK